MRRGELSYCRFELAVCLRRYCDDHHLIITALNIEGKIVMEKKRTTFIDPAVGKLCIAKSWTII